MNDYQKAIKRGIKTGLDNHFSKKESKKVWLTVEEAKRVKMFLDDAVALHDKGVVVIQSNGFETIQLIKERIEQAEMSIAST